MVFNSFLFLLIFLPLCMAGWYGLHALRRPRLALAFLIGMSLWFYGSFSAAGVFVLLLSLLVNYALSARAGKAVMIIGIIFNLALLAFYKYLVPAAPDTLSLIMPVGLSFYTFSQISFIIDRCRGEIPHDDLLHYAAYVTYFPKLIEGPITTYGEIMPQLAGEDAGKFRSENVLRGFLLLIFGMAKKMLIADVLAPVVSFGYSNAYYLDTLSVILVVTAYAFQLYCDFSGFCDMALGVSRMLGIDLPLNFDAPYHCTSYASFWQHWHITLTRFFTKYVYFPLGGSRRGALRTFINVMIVFLLSGIWHGNGWTYLAWGALNGLLVALARVHGRGGLHKGAMQHLLRIRTFCLFCFTLIFFGAPRIDYAAAMLRRFLIPMWPGFLYRIAANISIPELYPLGKAVSIFRPQLSAPLQLAETVLLLIICGVLVSGESAEKRAGAMPLSRRNAVLMGLLLLWCLISMTGVSNYLYFAF